MEISFFSFVMSVFWSSIGILLIYKFRRKDSFVSQGGIFSLFFILTLIVVRMFVVVEFSFVNVIGERNVYPRIQEFLRTDIIMLNKADNINIYSFLVIIWVLVSVILLVRLFVKYLKIYKYKQKLTLESNEFLEEYLYEISDTVCSELDLNVAPKIYASESIPVPCMFGFFKPIIFLPEIELSDEQWKYVILHELTHFKHKDMWIKLCIHIIHAIFWWNPLIYLLQDDLEQTLEIHCDMSIIKDKPSSEKIFYLNTLLSVFENVGSTKYNNIPNLYSPIVSSNQSSNLKQRFRIVKKSKHKNQNIIKTIRPILIAIALFIVSFVFILQPDSKAPEDPYDVDVLTLYLVDSGDNKYYAYTQDLVKFEISHEVFVEFLELGLEVRDE